MATLALRALLLVVCSHSSAPPPPVTCPCADPALCRPLSPQPAPRRELFAFTAAPATQNISQWETWPWDKITTLAPFQCLGPPSGEPGACEKGKVFTPGGPKHGVGQEMYCKAHAHGARVLTWGYGGWNGTHCPIGEYYKWWITKDPRVHNASAVKDWASRCASCVRELGYDGILLDMETIGGPPLGPVLERTLITTAVCELKTALTAAIPGSKLVWTVDTGPYFDFKEMTERDCVDTWLDMDYSRCASVEKHSLTSNRATAPVAFTASIVENFKAKGIPASRMGIIFPWMGCAYRCSSSTTGSSYGGCSAVESKLVGYPSFGDVIAHYLPNKTSDVFHNTSVQSKYLNYRGEDGKAMQVWYDDPETLAVKYREALSHGVSALGMWTADYACASYESWPAGSPEQYRCFNESAAAAMWAALPTLRVKAQL